MFASVMKSAVVNNGQAFTLPRVTVVVPDSPAGGSVTYWTRQGESKGIGWRKVNTPEVLPGESVLGKPASVAMTGNDWAALSKPTVLLQKLTREVDSVVPSSDDASTTLQGIVAEAITNPALLAKYLKANRNVTQVIPQPIVVAPIPTVNIMLEQDVPQPVVDTQPQFTQQKEEPMITLTQAAPASNLAVLTVPEPRLYIKRVKYGVSETDIYNFARNSQVDGGSPKVVVLTGDAGTGKTSSARNYAAEMRLPFVTVECTQQIDQSITQGRFVPTGHGNEMSWKYSQLASIIQGPGVVLINEVSRLNPKAASLFLRLLEEGELAIEPLNQVIKAHKDCLFVADQNVGAGYRGTQRQDDALLDRFNIKLEFEYDREIERQFIPSEALLDFATSIRQALELEDTFSKNVSTRMLQNFVEQAKGLGFEFAVNSMLNNFPKDEGERDAVKMRFDINHTRIAEELGVAVGSYNK